MVKPTDIKPIALVEVDGEPRAKDLEIGKRLGLKRPRAIRQVVERNKAELETFGPIATQRGAYRGKEFDEYHLNEEQALLLAILSDADNAPAVRRVLIEAFVAWRRGHLVPATAAPAPISLADDRAARSIIGGIVKACSAVVVEEKLAEALPMIASDVAAETIRALRVEGMMPAIGSALAVASAPAQAPASPTSIPALIGAHQTLVALDEALYDNEGAPKGNKHQASDSALGLVINALIAAPCASLEDARAKAIYLMSAPIGDREPVVSSLAPGGADPFDPAGALLSLLRSLAGEPPPSAAAA